MRNTPEALRFIETASTQGVATAITARDRSFGDYSQAPRARQPGRTQLFLQTKFTYQPGQDRRLPYDPTAGLSTQVAQSMASSLEHLGTDHVDSYVLHGPASGYGWTDDDAETWAAMAKERDAGRTRLLGVSNVSLRHLAQMAATGAEAPAFVQDRCFARLGWDRDVRAFCRERNIVYRGFSLLTANPEVLRHPLVAGIAARNKVTLAHIVFRFAQAVGMLPLTGTSNAEHMTQDLASRDLPLSAERCERSSRCPGDGGRARPLRHSTTGRAERLVETPAATGLSMPFVAGDREHGPASTREPRATVA